MHRSHRAFLFCAFFALLQNAQQVWGAAPEITAVSPRGLRIGATTSLTISGANLGPQSLLVLGVPTSQQVVREGSTGNQIQVDVTLDASVSPGIYQLRVVTPDGISAPVGMGIDSLPQQAWADQIPSLPIALSGQVQGSDVMRTTFAGKAGEQITIDVESRRLGIESNLVVHLYAEGKRELAFAQANATSGQDTRLVHTLAADGNYTISIHDALYRGPAPGSFRLKVGALYYADLVFPLAVKQGSRAELQLLGGSFAQGEKLSFLAPEILGSMPAGFPRGAQATGPAPRVMVTGVEELMEPPLGQPLPAITLPVGINGRISESGQEDVYTIPVSEGQALRIELTADRMGSPLDASLSIRNMAGMELAAADDQPNSKDPALDFTVPAGNTSLVIAIRDVAGRGGDRFIYRLGIEPAGRPDFRLTILDDKFSLPQGGFSVVRVHADRQGYNGTIRLSVLDLPAGVTLSGAEIPAGATDTLVALHNTSKLPVARITQLIGESTEGDAKLRRRASFTTATTPAPLKQDLGLAVAAPAPLGLTWSVASGPADLPRGGQLPIAVSIARSPQGVGAVRLSLMTTQAMPKKTVKNAFQQDVQVDDPDRLIRFEGAPMIAADQNAAGANLLVPIDLSGPVFDVTVKAELLAADGNTVVASVFSPPLRLPSVAPFSVQLSGENKVAALSGTGESGRIVGKIVRRPGFVQPVVLSLAGLPDLLPTPKLEVAADQTDFSFPIAFPQNSPLGPVGNVRLVAEASTSAGVPALKAAETPIELTVVPGGPAPNLYKLFEDEAGFLAYLNEGDAQTSIETLDRLAGSGAIKVTPGQKSRARIPGMAVKIAESPMPGEFRYMRFAWKKQGGGNILLQLNANGAWGPGKDATTPSFRYEAGPKPNPLNLAALKIDEKLPDGWVVVTRDLFADFGTFSFDGLAFNAPDGEFALFDHLYLARSMEDFAGCPPPVQPEQPLAIFDEQAEFPASLTQGAGMAEFLTAEKHSGTASLKVTPDQKFNPALAGLSVKIRQNPAQGEYRFIRFAWRKQGGERICLQVGHDGKLGPQEGMPQKYRYDAGPGAGESLGAAIRVSDELPAQFTVVTRDLFADFGEFTFTGIGLSPLDGEFGLFDHIYLGRTPRDFELVKP